MKSLYKVTSIEWIEHATWRVTMAAGELLSSTMKVTTPGATAFDVLDRGLAKCRQMNKYYGAEKFANKNSPYRTLNRARLESK